MKLTEGQHYNIQDIGNRVELTSNLIQGLIKGVAKLTAENYTILYDTITTRGSMYIVVADKPKESKKGGDPKETLLEKELQELKIENRTNKSLITRLRNKIEKLENEK